MPEALPPIERRANILAATPPLRLGVNIDHVATVRNARGGTHPDPVRAAMIAIEAGADGITAHLREDRRHIRDADIARLKAEIVKPLNLEMAATPELVAIAVKTRPHAACIVPERRGEVTTEGGLDAFGQYNLLAPAWVAQRTAAAEAEWRRIVEGARLAAHLGLEVHAGHGLDYGTAEMIAGLAEIVELNIGHFLVGEAIFSGLAAAIARMRVLMDEARAGAGAATAKRTKGAR